MNKQISVIGCGWLGFPLAKHLIKHKYTIKGSTRSNEKLEVLRMYGIDPFLVNFDDNEIKGELENCLRQSEILVLNIPPGLKNNPNHDFTKYIELLIPCIEGARINHVLFISSTSVYSDSEAIPVITEKSNVNPETRSGKQLLIAEQLLQSNSKFQTTILRFSGLIGENRHPAVYLSGRHDIKNPDAPINLIHQDDCIEIIHSLIKEDIWNDTFNASTPYHPSRKDYYESICEIMKISPPQFDFHGKSRGKEIDSSRLVQKLNYSFQIKL